MDEILPLEPLQPGDPFSHKFIEFACATNKEVLVRRRTPCKPSSWVVRVPSEGGANITGGPPPSRFPKEARFARTRSLDLHPVRPLSLVLSGNRALHDLKKTYRDRLEIRYKTFLLAPTPEARSLSKEEILGHWAMVKEHPGGERVDPALMATRDFPYPHSMPGAVAIKAAAAQGPEAEARYVERIEEAHLVDCLDIADDDVLIGLASGLGLDVSRFEDLYRNADLERAVRRDH